jgi:hypothetical protein
MEGEMKEFVMMTIDHCSITKKNRTVLLLGLTRRNERDRRPEDNVADSTIAANLGYPASDPKDFDRNDPFC